MHAKIHLASQALQTHFLGLDNAHSARRSSERRRALLTIAAQEPVSSFGADCRSLLALLGAGSYWTGTEIVRPCPGRSDPHHEQWQRVNLLLLLSLWVQLAQK